jgi:hypothetical protein
MRPAIWAVLGHIVPPGVLTTRLRRYPFVSQAQARTGVEISAGINQHRRMKGKQ